MPSWRHSSLGMLAVLSVTILMLREPASLVPALNRTYHCSDSLRWPKFLHFVGWSYE